MNYNYIRGGRMNTALHEDASLWIKALVSSVLSVALLSGCAGPGGLKLYDGTKAAVATQAREAFQGVEITAVVDQNIENLDAVLERELAVVDDDFKLQRDRALLIMADSRKPTSAWLGERRKELGALGFRDMAAVAAYEKKLRTFENEMEKAQKNARFVRALGEEPPKCQPDVQLPPQLTPSRPPKDADKLRTVYARYRKACRDALAKAPANLSDGMIGAAQKGLDQEFERLTTERRDAAALEQSVASAASAFALARKEAMADPTAEKVEALQSKAKQLRAVLEEAAETGMLLESEHAAVTYIEELSVILTAFATGEVDEADIDEKPALRAAATVVGALPSFATEAGALLSSGGRPTVSDLLIELNHQRILLERAKEKRRLSERTIALHRQKIDALLAQAGEIRKIQLHLCSLAVLAAGGQPPEARCDQFSYAQSGESLACELEESRIPSCILGKRWSELLTDRSLEPRQKRQLYAAVLAYGRAMERQAEVTKTDFRIIDIAHRRTAISNRAALLAWHNLVDVPTAQLAAYHESGITPDALAQAIANLLGLTAIAVGAAQ